MSAEFNSQSQIQIQSQTQLQTLSPQQVLEVRLLELPSLELEERVRAELLDNPALEENTGYDGEDTSASDDGDFAEDGNTYDREADFLSEDDMPDYYNDPSAGRSDAVMVAEIPLSDAVSFYELLREQLGEQSLTERERQIADYLIGSLDENGFLCKPVGSISTELAVNIFIDADDAEIERVLRIIQGFDPAGIGARNLQECLLLQLHRKRQTDECRLAIRIIGECFDEFKNLRRDRIALKMGASEAETDQAFELIGHLNPRPGFALGETDRQGGVHIVPDFTVECYDGSVQFSLNNFNIPELRLSRSFLETLNAQEGSSDSDVRQAAVFIRRKIDAAQGFIDALRQREKTLMHTMQAITDMQRDYFLSGDESRLRPMILKDVAERTGLDISTISRATNGKYAETDFGIVHLKDLFTDGVTGADGIEVSVREIYRIIREAVAGEDRSAPLTDDSLSAMLKERGYDVARRTVAKYRDQLGIPVSRLRR